ncbi:MAG: MarR family winged helix-turn-helix transcriptional regulator [Pseudomonadota bacterium]
MNKNTYADVLRELIRQLIRNSSFQDKAEASCCGTTVGQCYAISEIGRAEALSLNELAGLLNLDNSTMSRTINNLVDQGLVTRETDPQDRRYVKMRLTDRGLAIFRSIEENMDSYYRSLLKYIPEDKHEQMIESLKLLLEAMKKIQCC